MASELNPCGSPGIILSVNKKHLPSVLLKPVINVPHGLRMVRNFNPFGQHEMKGNIGCIFQKLTERGNSIMVHAKLGHCLIIKWLETFYVLVGEHTDGIGAQEMGKQ